MATRCEECAYFVYDDEYEEYMCEINLDEDEVARFYGFSAKQYNAALRAPGAKMVASIFGFIPVLRKIP